jgi:L,D-transpeptidase catalytic domain
MHAEPERARSWRRATARGWLGATLITSLLVAPTLTALVSLTTATPASAVAAQGPNSVTAFGSAAVVTGNSGPLPGPVAGMASTADGFGYWTVTASGGVTGRGDAGIFGSMLGQPLNAPILSLAPTADSNGYWLVGADGGIFSFGDAHFFGSTGNMVLNRPVVGLSSTKDGQGYWMVASDGGIFSFGDAPFYGSTGSMALNAPIVGMAPTPDGGGYWLVAADGGIFSFGDAPFFGSAGGFPLAKPVVGMAATTDGQGYFLVASDGGVFTYGDAHYIDSGTGSSLVAPVVAIAARPDGYWIAYGQTADWTTPLGQEQLLAQLGYLPVSWDTTYGFRWLWAGLPPQLTSQWVTGQYNMVLKGAIWAFEYNSGLPMNGNISTAETGALLNAANNASTSMNPNGYTYSLGQEFGGTSQPETLTVWHNGVVVQQTATNSGIPDSPTAIGTFPVYQRYRNQIMTGTNPDGTPYADPVQYVAYFTGGDAIHYMPRARYGYPQSLGCLEIPLTPASVIWNYTYYGSLVTVTP